MHKKTIKEKLLPEYFVIEYINNLKK